jgi:hypothetical protein
MKLFLISQVDEKYCYAYDSAVVCAPDEDAARLMDPGGKDGEPANFGKIYSWCSSADKVVVQLIGEAAPSLPLGVVCASFNGG